MKKQNTKKTTPRIQKDGWNKGKHTTKFRSSVYMDEDIGKVLKEKSKQLYDGVMSRCINQELRQHFKMVS